MTVEFTTENKKKVEELLPRYPTKRAALLPVLWLAQGQFGHLSLEVQEYVARLLELPMVKVYEVVTFYTMFHQKPVGTFHFQICRTLSCELCGKEEIMAHLKNRLGIGVGETTPDGRFTLSEVECLGSCGSAPMLQLNEDYHENLTVEKVNEILKRLG